MEIKTKYDFMSNLFDLPRHILYNFHMQLRIVGNICACFGHSTIREQDDIEYLKNEVQRHYINLIENCDVKTFLFGGLGEFDYLCQEVINDLKKEYPFIERVFIYPTFKDVYKNYWKIDKSNFEQMTYLELDFNYWYQRIYYRNCEIIKLSNYLIFYLRDNNRSGAQKTFEFAKRKKKIIYNI